MWKWVAILFVVSAIGNAFQKTGNPILEGVGSLSVLVTLLLAYRAWRRQKEAKKLSGSSQKENQNGMGMEN